VSELGPDLTYPIVLVQQALVLHREHGTVEQWDRWAAEAERYMKESG
jgi:hypothetical protein